MNHTPGDTALLTSSTRPIDLRVGNPDADDVANGATWDASRQVHAEVLRSVLTRRVDDADPTTPLRLEGARIVGELDLDSLAVPRPLHLVDCYFDEPLRLRRTAIPELVLSGSHVPFLVAKQLNADGDVLLNDGFCAQEIDLTGGRVGGNLSLSNATLSNPRKTGLAGAGLIVEQGMYCRSVRAEGEIVLIGADIKLSLSLTGATLTNDEGWALDAQGMHVGQALFLGNSIPNPSGFTAHGGIRLAGVTVEGFLSLRGAHITPKAHGTAISGTGLHVASELLMDQGSTFEGLVYLANLRVGEDWRMTDSQFTHPGKTALLAQQSDVGGSILCTGRFTSHGSVDLSDSTIHQSLDLTGATVADAPRGVQLRRTSVRRLTLAKNSTINHLDLRHARIEVLDDSPGTTPKEVRLQGATIEAAGDTSPGSVAHRLDWLTHDPDGYAPQPYDQLAAMYRRVGQEDPARRVKMTSLRRRRGTLNLGGRVWSRLLDITVGYGYRTWLAGLWLVTLTVPSAAYFAYTYPEHFAAAVDKPPGFQPLIYAIDTVLPVIDFGQSTAWHPSGPSAWASWLLIAVGWVLTTALAAGIAQTLRSE